LRLDASRLGHPAPTAPRAIDARDVSRVKQRLALVGLLAAIGWGIYSYQPGGLIFALLGSTESAGESVERLRVYLARWGPLAPAIYVLAVVIEVMVAPIPGTLLYAPAGALFGGGLGGTLSLAGNVMGAMLACLVARLVGERLTTRLDESALAAYRRRIAARGGWIVFLLRVNPLTSSDLVSYAAGLTGVPVWKVGLGTLAGMAPLCYAQAYLADRLFRILPGSLWIIVVLGGAYAALVIWVIVRTSASSGRQ
jgi:uncharacterized membrane protein YdjX (TVP38/TMEM64 family)